MTRIFARQALTRSGWQQDLSVEIGEDGRIAALGGGADADHRVGVLLPAPANLHSHAFQRAMAGLTEGRTAGRDSFWSWRTLMYRFAQSLTPDDVEAIAAAVQLEMLQAGYAAVGEFHYLHHQPDGSAYAAPAELSHRTFAAAAETGIGLTHLPVLYSQGGLDGRPLEGGQRRFGCDRERFAALLDDARVGLRALPADARLGVAPHSLRAVGAAELDAAASLLPDAPIHLHIAEQTAEVEEVKQTTGQTPVAWLFDHQPVDQRWCLIHATHMTPAETGALAASGAIAGLCPITEANLGDGIFPGSAFLDAGGRLGIGSDSNIRIALAEELRMLEYGQRLRDRERAVLASEDRSTGRRLFEAAAAGGARALGRDAGRIEPGALADLVALDDQSTACAGLSGDRILDSWIFAADDRVVTDVWSAGRHVIKDRRHPMAASIAARFRIVLKKLRAEL
jgi:formimidoylglutamate deiminase